MRRDSCSSVALPRNAKSFAPLRGKPPYGAPNITEPLKGRKNKERIRQIQRQRKDRKAKFGYGITVSLFAWRAIRKQGRRPRARQCAGIRAQVLRCRATRRALPPCVTRRKGNSAKRCFCRSGRSRYNFTKTKVLKRKRQKSTFLNTVSLFAWRAVRKRRRTSRAAARRDSCSSGARSTE